MSYGLGGSFIFQLCYLSYINKYINVRQRENKLTGKMLRAPSTFITGTDVYSLNHRIADIVWCPWGLLGTVGLCIDSALVCVFYRRTVAKH